MSFLHPCNNFAELPQAPRTLATDLRSFGKACRTLATNLPEAVKASCTPATDLPEKRCLSKQNYLNIGLKLLYRSVS